MPGADIEVDGAYVGSTPSTLPLSSGAHQVSVRSGNATWQRNLQLNAGSSITVNAMLEQVQVVAHRTR
ncbi:MAG: PEGA domain-containing protein [Bryobacteraceae bacterium]